MDGAKYFTLREAVTIRRVSREWLEHAKDAVCYVFGEQELIAFFLRRATMGVFPDWSCDFDPYRLADGKELERLHWILDRTVSDGAQYLGLGNKVCSHRFDESPKVGSDYWTSPQALAVRAAARYIQATGEFEEFVIRDCNGDILFNDDGVNLGRFFGEYMYDPLVQEGVEGFLFDPRVLRAVYFFNDDRLTLLFLLARQWTNVDEGVTTEGFDGRLPFVLLYNHLGYTSASEEYFFANSHLTALERWEVHVLELQANRWCETDFDLQRPGEGILANTCPFRPLRDLHNAKKVCRMWKDRFGAELRSRLELHRDRIRQLRTHVQNYEDRLQRREFQTVERRVHYWEDHAYALESLLEETQD